MNKLLKPFAATLFLTHMGFIQAVEPAKQKVTSGMARPATQAPAVEGHSMPESMSEEGKQFKHNHREFEGLPADPTQESAEQSRADPSEEASLGHNHRKQHK